MAKTRRKQKQREQNTLEPANEIAYFETKKVVKPLRALNESQYQYITSIKNNTVTFALGPAGTGKTFIAGAIAAEWLTEGTIEKVVITRPGVEAGESFGFLPGELQEKYAPFIEPFVEVLNERLGKSTVDYLLKRDKLQAKPLAFMRGATFKNALCILDEAQNTTPAQMKLFLTRIGQDAKVIIDGDIEQKDIGGLSGLQDAVNRLSGVPSIGCVDFDLDDCVRSGIVRDILMRYR